MCGENDNTFSFTHPNCPALMGPRTTRSCGVMSAGRGSRAVGDISHVGRLDPGCRTQVGIAVDEEPEDARLSGN